MKYDERKEPITCYIIHGKVTPTTTTYKLITFPPTQPIPVIMLSLTTICLLFQLPFLLPLFTSSHQEQGHIEAGTQLSQKVHIIVTRQPKTHYKPPFFRKLSIKLSKKMCIIK